MQDWKDSKKRTHSVEEYYSRHRAFFEQGEFRGPLDALEKFEDLFLDFMDEARLLTRKLETPEDFGAQVVEVLNTKWNDLVDYAVEKNNYTLLKKNTFRYTIKHWWKVGR